MCARRANGSLLRGELSRWGFQDGKACVGSCMAMSSVLRFVHRLHLSIVRASSKRTFLVEGTFRSGAFQAQTHRTGFNRSGRPGSTLGGPWALSGSSLFPSPDGRRSRSVGVRYRWKGSKVSNRWLVLAGRPGKTNRRKRGKRREAHLVQDALVNMARADVEIAQEGPETTEGGEETMAEPAVEEYAVLVVAKHGSQEAFRRILNSLQSRGSRLGTSTMRLLCARALEICLEDRAPLSAEFLSLLLAVFPKEEWNKMPEKLLASLAGVLTWYALQYVYGIEEPEWESFRIAVKQAFGGMKNLPEPMQRQLYCLLGCEGNLQNLEGWLNSRSPFWEANFNVIKALEALVKESYDHVLRSCRIQSVLTALEKCGNFGEQDAKALAAAPKEQQPDREVPAKPANKDKPQPFNPRMIPSVEQMKEMPLSLLLDLFFCVYGYRPEVKEKMTLIKKLHGYAQSLLGTDMGEEVESPWKPPGTGETPRKNGLGVSKTTPKPSVYIGRFVYSMDGNTQIRGTVYRYDNTLKKYHVMFETGGKPEEYTEEEIEELLVDRRTANAQDKSGKSVEPLESAPLGPPRQSKSSKEQEPLPAVGGAGTTSVEEMVSTDVSGKGRDLDDEGSDLYVPVIVPKSRRILVERALKMGAKKATLEILRGKSTKKGRVLQGIPFEDTSGEEVVVVVSDSEEEGVSEQKRGDPPPRKRRLFTKAHVLPEASGSQDMSVEELASRKRHQGRKRADRQELSSTAEDDDIERMFQRARHVAREANHRARRS